MERIICIIIGYVFGMFQTAFFYGKMHGIDIREHGSGNAGTTNTLRVLGTKAGLIVFAGDVLKCMIAVWITTLIFKGSHADEIYLLKLYTAAGAILGHNFPFYMNFKGGKGIAASAGLIFALAFFDWKFLALGFCTFFIALIITKYVSFSSLCLMTGFLIEFIVWGQLGMVHNLESQDKVEAYILVGFLTALSYIRHKENIKRLINGTERKIGQKKEA